MATLWLKTPLHPHSLCAAQPPCNKASARAGAQLHYGKWDTVEWTTQCPSAHDERKVPPSLLEKLSYTVSVRLTPNVRLSCPRSEILVSTLYVVSSRTTKRVLPR